MKRAHDSEKKRLAPLLTHVLFGFFHSWRASWKHRKGFRRFEVDVDRSIKTDARMIELNKARKHRINEIIIEVGKHS